MAVQLSEMEIKIVYQAFLQLRDEVGLDYAQEIIFKNLYSHIHQYDYDKINAMY